MRNKKFEQENQSLPPCSLIEKPLSPERGQLLLALVKSDLDTLTYQNIYKKANFEYAYLKKANLKGGHLKKAVLNGVNLQGAGLTGTNMWNANLQDANLRDIHLMDANLQSAKLIFRSVGARV